MNYGKTKTALLSFCSRMRIRLLPPPGAGRSPPQAGISRVCIVCDLVHPSSGSHISLRLLFPSFLWSTFLFVPEVEMQCVYWTPSSQSILSSCPSHRTLFSRKNSSILSTPVILRILSLLAVSFRFCHITYAAFSFLLSSVFFHFPSSSLSI